MIDAHTYACTHTHTLRHILTCRPRLSTSLSVSLFFSHFSTLLVDTVGLLQRVAAAVHPHHTGLASLIYPRLACDWLPLPLAAAVAAIVGAECASGGDDVDEERKADATGKKRFGAARSDDAASEGVSGRRCNCSYDVVFVFSFVLPTKRCN
jgi:hypothetical protein